MVSISEIDWVSTLKVSFARGLAAAVVFGILFLSGYQILDKSLIVAWPIIGVLAATFYHYLFKVIGFIFQSLPGYGLMNAIFLFFASLTIAIGDPIVYTINRLFPKVLGITGFNIINLVPLFIVLKGGGEEFA